MNSVVKIHKIDLKDASKEIQNLLYSLSFEGGEIQSLKTEIWNDYLIICIAVLFND